jgi:hypothetical protein
MQSISWLCIDQPGDSINLNIPENKNECKVINHGVLSGSVNVDLQVAEVLSPALGEWYS